VRQAGELRATAGAAGRRWQMNGQTTDSMRTSQTMVASFLGTVWEEP